MRLDEIKWDVPWVVIKWDEIKQDKTRWDVRWD